MTALSIHLLSANWLIPSIAASQGVTCNDEENNNPMWHQSFLQPGVGATLQGAFSLSLSLSFFLCLPMWDLSSLTRDQSYPSCIGSMES